jgi:hypothetical protein
MKKDLVPQGIIFIRLNRVMIFRDIKEKQSNKNISIHMACIEGLMESYRIGYKIVIYTGMCHKNAIDVLDTIGIRRYIPDDSLLVLTGDDLIIDGKFHLDVAECVQTAREYFNLTGIVESYFYDCDRLAGIEKEDNVHMFLLEEYKKNTKKNMF